MAQDGRSGLKIAAWNCRGLLYKVNELLDFILSFKLDIVLLSETFLNINNSIKKAGFVIHRVDRPHHGGGVAIITKTNISHKLILTHTNSLESVAIQLTHNHRLLTIVSAYKPPNIPLDIKDINKLMSLGEDVVIAGDLNCKDTTWHCGRANRDGRKLKEFLSTSDLRILFPDSPTHFPPKGLPSVLDIALVKGSLTVSEVIASDALSSDHLPITFTIGGKLQCVAEGHLNYAKANWYKFKYYINNNLTIQNINNTNQIDQLIDHLTNTTNQAAKLSIPLNKSNTAYKSNKLPSHIVEIIKRKNRLTNRWRKTRCPQLKTIINHLIHEIRNLIIEHRNLDWEIKLKSLNTRDNSLWHLNKALKNRNSHIPALDNAQKIPVYDETEKSDLIADVFAQSHLISNFESEGFIEFSVSNSLKKIAATKVDNIEYTNLREIIDIVHKLRNKKAPGPDKINNTLIKHLPVKALVLLCDIFNACLSLSYFPDKWKTAKVVPIHKPGLTKSSPGSYRPISLLPCLSKIFEKLILSRLKLTIDEYIPHEQFGFKAQHCTTSQLTRLTQHIRGNFNHKKSTGMVLLDFKKAFDVVWHDGLIHKLAKMNTAPYLIKIIQSYLTNRHFSVHIRNSHSKLHSIPAGVPQGGILSPTLFNIFIYDIPKPEKSFLALYADDTAIFTTSNRLTTIRNRLQNSLKVLTKYYTQWKLTLNETKTEAILFTNKRHSHVPKLTINKTSISWLKEVKYLGVVLDSKLTFKRHVEHIISKTNSAICLSYPLINRRSKLSSHNKLILYKSVIRPIILYACPAWVTLAKSHKNKLQTIQNKCIKMCLNTPPGTFLGPIHDSINLNSVHDQIKNLSMKHHAKMIENNINPTITDLLKRNFTSKKRKFTIPIPNIMH